MHKNCTRPEKPKKQSSSSDYDAFLKEQCGDVLPLLLCIMEDIKHTKPLWGTADYAKDVETIQRRFRSEGLSFVTKTLPKFFDSVLSYLETGISSYPGWRKTRGFNYPAFLRRLVGPIYDHPYDESTAIYVQQLYQLTYAFKKLKGPYKQCVLDKQLVEFVNVDQDLNYLDFDNAITHSIIIRARGLVTDIFRGLNPLDSDQANLFLPKPGPGATNTPTKIHERFQPHVGYTQLTETFSDEWWLPPDHPPRGRRPWDLRVGRRKDAPFTYDVEDAPTSRFAFVHKTFGKPRCICIEQNETQYFQQAIKHGLVSRLENHPLTKGYVNFSDQTINGRLALTSSQTGAFATVDMSSASDRVSFELVERLFWDLPELLQCLSAVSARSIQLPDTINFVEKLPIFKFAPMGSAVCFPVMAVVHFALIHAIIQEFDQGATVKNTPVYVYGDDLLFHSRHIPAIFTWLPAFGMKINDEKSFHQSRFRESCGVHAYNGVDITPIKFTNLVKSPPCINDLISLLKHEAAFKKAGYSETASMIRSMLRRVPEYMAGSLPYVGPKSSVLGYIRESKDETTFYRSKPVKCRWNMDLQRFEYKVRVVEQRREPTFVLDSTQAYLRWLLLTPREAEQVVGSSVDDLIIRWKWVPSQALSSV